MGGDVAGINLKSIGYLNVWFWVQEKRLFWKIG
jgi:hypothetical protein